MKITEFRSKYADGKLKEKLDDVSSAIMLYALYQDYVRVSHQESREYRLIDADVIIVSDSGNVAVCTVYGPLFYGWL